ncbi:MAG: hypothetical protein WCH05_09720 [Chlorobiaceae bacterium]
MTRLKALIASMTLLLLSLAPDAMARDGVGLGLIAGEPTGVSVKFWLDDRSAIDGALAVSLADNNPFQVHADYLVHSSSSVGAASELKGSMPWYYGIGGRIKDNRFGVRVPLGITYLFNSAPMDLFAEIVPILDVTPSTEFALNGALGLRYYFH